MKKIVFIAYGLFLILFTAFSYLFIDSNFIPLRALYTGFYTTSRLATTIVYGTFLTIFFGFYIYFIYALKNKTYKKKDIVLLTAISIFGLIFSYPSMLSYDIFNYTTTSKVLFGYMENPYIIMPIEFPNDPFLLYTHAANKVALYGPFWLLLTGLPYFLGFGNVLLTILGFKAIAAGCYLLILYFIWKLTNNLESVVIFGLNPLVLIETMISAHNDVVMMALAMASFYFIRDKRIALAVTLFVLSILIKYATLFLAPVYLMVVWLMYKKRKIDWTQVYTYSAVFMLLVFSISPLREELYPWYFIWILPFSVLTENKKIIQFVIVLSYALMLRYIPFMYLGDYFGPTPLIRSVLTTLPLLGYLFYVLNSIKLTKYFK